MAKVSGHASPEATLAVVFTSTSIAAICVGLRLWTRFGIVRQPGLDDLIVTLSIFFTAIFSSCVAVQVKYGLGKHQADLSDHENYNLLKWFWVSIWNYYLGLGLAKLSIILQCLRIFGSIPVFKKWALVLGSIIFVFTLWTVFVSIFLCHPVSYFWNPDQPGSCLNRLPIWFFNSSFSIATDIATAILPLPVVKSLNLPRKQRRMLLAVFGLGGAICIVSLVRFYCLYAIAVSKDPSWDNPQAALYANLEATVGIIASCLPTMKGLISRYFPRWFASSPASHDRSFPTPVFELSDTGKSNTKNSTLLSEGSRSRSWSQDWNALSSQKEKRTSRFGRKIMTGKTRLTSTEIEGGRPVVDDAISPAKEGEIKVTTILEQVEGRNIWQDSKESLVQVAPFERP